MAALILDILSKNQLRSTSIFVILYFYLNIPVGSFYSINSCIWWNLAI